MDILKELNRIARQELQPHYSIRRDLSAKAVKFLQHKHPDCEVKEQRNGLFTVKYIKQEEWK